MGGRDDGFTADGGAVREEQKALREFEREKARPAKERSHYQAALAKLEANVRAGYVYVISNVGAFGDRMIKIGMTRRLDPHGPGS